MKTARYGSLGFLVVCLSLAGWALHAGAAVTLTSPQTLSPGDTSLEGQEVIVDHTVLTVSGTHRFQSLRLVNGAVLTHPPAPTGEAENVVRLILTAGLVVDADSRVDANGLGYANAEAPGAGRRGSFAGGGGGHGGDGTASAGSPAGAGGSSFGAVLDPGSWGGPGANGGNAAFSPGGGWVVIEAGGEVQLDGVIRANGANATVDNQGGGAGGTVVIRCATVRGAGAIRVDGGNGEWVEGGGGGGGRIAMFYARNDFTGTLSAVGGGGAGRGGAGTIYLKPADGVGEVRLQNASRGAWTPVDSVAAYRLDVGADAVAVPRAPLDIAALRIQAKGVLVQSPGSTGLVVRISGDARVDEGGAITADGRGYPVAGDRGPGSPTDGGWAGAGGGHGGWGGTSRSGGVGGAAYGAMLQPVSMGSQGGNGSGGAGMAGGGLVRLVVGGTLTVDGSCTAEGLSAGPDNVGGGAGGSVWIDAGAFAGGGRISVNGGGGEWVDGGGGSGGRIALYTRGSLFAGQVTATGGGGNQKGAAGTIYVRRADESEGFLRIDNQGGWGAMTPLTSPETFRLWITNRAVCYPEAPLRLAELVVSPETVLTHLTGQTNLELHVDRDLIVAEGGQLTADGKGYPIFEDRGPGLGVQVGSSGSGGGYGGMGGHSNTGGQGGGHYGVLDQPISLGSQGGNGSGGAGAAGGGAIRLVVTGNLVVDGRLTADGLGTGVDNAGGGSGGSVWLTVGTLSGKGTLSANGGAGEWVEGGGGAGGRIALYYGADTFTGTLSTWGGGGRERGGAGTIYRRPAGSAVGQLLVHNGGTWGNYTPIESPFPYDLVLAGKAYAYPVGPLTLQSIEIHTNAELTHLSSQTNLSLRILSAATVREGGSINVDGRGYAASDATAPGSGVGLDCCGSGGGHGGLGATSRSGAVSGLHNDSLLTPLLRGSAGGPGSGGAGAPGGGAIRLVVDGELTVDGRITANGHGTVTDNAGGGAGGSVWITAGSFAGSGLIAADGGAGEWVEGGGGGGGRIAAYYGASTYKGGMTAYGGGTSRRGGAGTIYQRRDGAPRGALLVHNGGYAGDYTPLTSPEAFDLVLAERAYAYPEGPLTVQTLEVRTNSTLTHLTGQPRCEVTALDSITVTADAAIQADGRGFPVGDHDGPGAGMRSGPHGSGGGHGGRGGSAANGAEGGLPYDSYSDPDLAGSRGGAGSGGSGGAGGGVIRLKAGGNFVLDGRLSAVGLGTSADNAGGGAGGSLHVTAGTLSGSGEMLVDGGVGEWVEGGGGAGGRIALHLGRDAFTGTKFARGGGRRYGGSGTIFTRIGSETGGTLVLDNGGNGGALTPLAVSKDTRLVITAGTTLHPVGNLEVASLRVQSGATLTHTNGQSGLVIQVAGDFALETGATLTASGKGYPVGADAGPGTGSVGGFAGAGGAHGGNGGEAAPGGIAGGIAYGSVLEPITYGSSGAPGGGDSNPRSPGGGAIRVVVGGTFTLDGTVACDGSGAWYDNQGGAAGGSVWITTATLRGAGTITANGGAGEWVEGGGGAGGRIAVYASTNDFAGTLAARGGGGRQTGGAGTIYTRQAGESVGRLLLNNAGNWGAYTPLEAPEAYHVTLTNRAQSYPVGVPVLGSLTAAPETVLSHLKGQEAMAMMVLGDARIQGVIDVNGRGYPVGNDRGPGAGATESSYGGGAGHGGPGGAGRGGAAGGAEYGLATAPMLWGSMGGNGSGGAGGDGGGTVRLVVGGTLTLDGAINANGLGASRDNAGGGSGGSILISARSFSGEGRLSATGGGGEWVDGGGGAGGRIALYRTANQFTGAIALSGGGGFAKGADGTLHEGGVTGVAWISPSEGWLGGMTTLEVAAFAGSDAPATVEFLRWSNGMATTLARVTGVRLSASAPWDTQGLANGPYELEAVLSDASGKRVGTARRAVIVQNAVTWHRGVLASNETWTAGRVHGVQADLTVPSGVVLTLEPGAVVKVMPGVRIVLAAGGKIVSGGTAAAPVTLTSFPDDSVGGDSNLDGDLTRPQPGAWRFASSPGSTFETGEATRIRYHSQSYGGSLASDESWTSDSLREITETLVVPSGRTLRIEAGVVVKFSPGKGLDVNNGGRLEIVGTAVQPVVLTSRKDDAFAGDTNEDGSRTAPAAGDWRSIRIADGGAANVRHALIRFGGNSVGNPWGAGGALEALGGPVTVSNSVISDALKDGAFCYGTTRFENCLVLRCDRGLTAVGTMEIVHCTVDQCRIGLLEHVGQLNVRNTIVSRSIDAGIEHDLGGGVPLVTHCNVWNPEAGRGNYSGVTDRTGRDGNISAAPRYKDPENDNFRLNFASPGIDAGRGADAPATDFAGTPRYDDPRTGNTGTPAANGAVPDTGAFEFAETAPSNLDVTVVSVRGPSDLTAGETVRVEWTILNRGAEAFSGPWHDAIYLQHASSGERLLVAEPLVGRAATLGPGQTLTVGADVRVPGGVVADYRWVVDANSRDDIFEGANAGNNESASASASSLTVPIVPLDGGPVSGSFAAQEEQHWFRVVAPVGTDVRFTLDLGAVSGATELYIGRGFMPTTERFSARHREFGVPDTTAIGPGAAEPAGSGGPNVFYVLAVGRVLTETPAAFTLGAAAAPFGIDSVATTRVGNSGLVTLEILGTGLGSDTSFVLRLAGQERRDIRRSTRQAGRVFATFDLAGFPAGAADLVAEQGGLGVTRSAAVEVVAGGAGDFYAELSGPDTTRAGRMTTWFITYGNRGLVDVRLPLLRFHAPGAREIRLFDSTLNWADSFTYLALNPDVLLPTLGPGQEATFTVQLKVMNPTPVRLHVVSGDKLALDATSFNWTTLPATAGADPTAWAAMVGTLPARLGATVGDYAALLERDLARIAADDLHFTYLANVNGRWLFGDERSGESEFVPIVELPPGAAPDLAGPSLQAAPKKKIPGDGIRKTYVVVITMEDYSRARAEGVGANDLYNDRFDWQDVRQFVQQDLRIPDDRWTGGHDYPGDNSTWSRNNIVSELSSFAGKVDADDNLVIVYSGHGGRTESGATGYLVANGGGSVSPHAFAEAIDAVGAGTTYFINHSCHSEAFNELVKPENTTFVGYSSTSKDTLSWVAHGSGGEMLSRLKSQLRKCNGLDASIEKTTKEVTEKYAGKTNVLERMRPVLTNPGGVDLSGKPWEDPSKFKDRMADVFNNLPAPGVIAGGTLNIVGSVDPNDKYALAGAGPAHWVHPSQVLPFEIVFENKTNAAAPAQEVLVTDDLDPRLDWSTFELKDIAFNDTKVAVPPGLQRFTATTRVGTDPYPVDIEVALNPLTGRIEWLMRSRDPATGDLPEDPFAGFLPPNDATRRGEGSLSYTVRPKPGLPDGTAITNRATIVFDPTYGANPPILTPWVTNTLDGLAPSSAIQPLPAEAVGEVPVQWSGQDAPNGSGIGSYDIYVSRDGTAYTPWLMATTDTGARFLGEPGSSYRFYSVARDLAGNTEAAPDRPDATVQVGGGGAGPVSIAFDGARVRVTFPSGVLQSAPSLQGPWTDIPHAVSPVVLAPTGTAQFFRTRR